MKYEDVNIEVDSVRMVRARPLMPPAQGLSLVP